MKISSSKNDLLNGIQIVYKAVPSKTTMTILEELYYGNLNPTDIVTMPNNNMIILYLNRLPYFTLGHKDP